MTPTPGPDEIGTEAQWTALQREASLAADHMSAGVMALGRANYTSPGQYHVAFFALSIGLERACKLALLLDALTETGAYPSEAHFRKFKHRLLDLLRVLDAVAERRCGAAAHCRLPNEPVHVAIVDILTDFASNITRYYNLDLLTESVRGADPVARWYTEVVLAEYASGVSEEKRATIDRNASMIATMADGTAGLWHTGEAGERIESLFDASRRTGVFKATQPLVRARVLQIHRFVGTVVSELGGSAQQSRYFVPYMSEFFGRFDHEDREFMRRTTW